MLHQVPLLALGRQPCENALRELLQPLLAAAKVQVLAPGGAPGPAAAVPGVRRHARGEGGDLRVDVAAVLFGREAVLVVSVVQRGAVHGAGGGGELQVQVLLVVQREARVLVRRRRRRGGEQAAVLRVTLTCCARVGRHVSMVEVVVSRLGTEDVGSAAAHGVVEEGAHAGCAALLFVLSAH